MKSYRNLIKDLIKESFDKAIKTSPYKIEEVSRGLTARSPGEVFKKGDDEIVFDSIVSFPADSETFNAYETKDETTDNVNAWAEQNGIQEVNFTNSPNKAALVAVFKRDDKPIAFVRYLKAMRSHKDGLWTDFTKKTGYERQQITSMAEKLPLKPSDLVKTEKVLTIDQLVSTVITNIRASDAPDDIKEQSEQLINTFYNKKDVFVSGAAKYATAYVKYIGELLAPIALFNNYKTEGDYEESERVLLGEQGYSYSDLSVMFPMSVSNPLHDSIVLTSDEAVKVGISSKAKSGGGAAASVTGLIKTLNEKVPQEWKDQNKGVVEILETINDNSQVMGPLVLGVKFGIITEKEKEYIRQRVIEKSKKRIPKNLKDVANVIAANTDKPGYTDGYHLLAGVAKKVGDAINATDEFDRGVRAILNRSSMVQVYTSVKKKGDDLKFDTFKVKYPPVFDGRVIADPSKNYYAAGCGGKLGFKFK